MFSRLFIAGSIASVAMIAVQPSLLAQTPDSYLWLEAVDSARAMHWVRAENQKTVAVLEKDPRYAGLHRDALAIAEAKDRIPAPTALDGAIFNLWQDSDHVRGIWRRTTPQSYRSPSPQWTTVLDLDALAKAEKANWFMKDAACVEPDERHCMLSLSDGGEDAVTVREFDIQGAHFASSGFVLPREIGAK